MYLGFEQAVVDTFHQTISALEGPPAGATHAELQADTNHVRYTMDGTVPTMSKGMLLLTTEPPKLFLIEDLLRIKFISAAATNAKLNIHYSGGRE